MIISLTGFMGCGKSSIGRSLSKLLCCSYVDLDEMIEKMTGKTIAEIFESDGESSFRALEQETLEAVIDKASSTDLEELTILSLGGGTVMTGNCARMVRDNTLCIYLRATVDTLVQNLKDEAEGRPMLASGLSLHDRIAELLTLRSAIYENTAHIIIDTDGNSIDETVKDIVQHLR